MLTEITDLTNFTLCRHTLNFFSFFSIVDVYVYVSIYMVSIFINEANDGSSCHNPTAAPSFYHPLSLPPVCECVHMFKSAFLMKTREPAESEPGLGSRPTS